MKTSLRLSTLGLSTALALSGLAVVSPNVPGFHATPVAAAAEITAGMPRNFFKEGELDASYDKAYNTFDKLYRARSFYAAAFMHNVSDDKEKFLKEREVRDRLSHLAEMENGARGMVILQALDYKIPGNGEGEAELAARDIDLYKLGTDADSRDKAFRLLDHATKAYRAAKEGDAVITARYEFINKAKSDLWGYVNVHNFRAPTTLVLNLGLDDSLLVGKTYQNIYEDEFSWKDAEGMQVVKTETKELPAEATPEMLESAEVNKNFLENDYVPDTTPDVDAQKAFNEVYAIVFAATAIVDEYQYLGESGADVAELSAIQGAADKLHTKLVELRDSKQGQAILDEKPNAEDLKNQADKVVAELVVVLKKKAKDSVSASLATAKEIKSADLEKQANELLADIDAAETYKAITALQPRVEKLAAAVATAKEEATPLTNGNTEPGDKDPNKDPEQEKPSEKLDGGAIAGIVIGVLALLGAILGGIFHFFPQLKAMLHLPTRF